MRAAPVATSATIRSTRQVVLPVPAAASTSIVVPSSSTIARRAPASASGRSGVPRAVMPSLLAQLPESHERRFRRRRELLLRTPGGLLGAAADHVEFAEAAVVFGD